MFFSWLIDLLVVRFNVHSFLQIFEGSKHLSILAKNPRKLAALLIYWANIIQLVELELPTGIDDKFHEGVDKTVVKRSVYYYVVYTSF